LPLTFKDKQRVAHRAAFLSVSVTRQ